MKTDLQRLVCCLVAAVAFGLAHAEVSPYSVIPLPAKIEMTKGKFTLRDEGVKVYITGAADDALAAYLKECALRCSEVKKRGDADVEIAIGKKQGKGEIGAEGYRMEIKPKVIKIAAASDAGAFYAVQTLLQMTQDGRERELKCCMIGDEPRFGYRGLHFDVSRHFRTVEFLKKQIDAMALLKMNVMHLHLTDGAGWRMEVKSYPRLTELAAWRPARTWQEWVDGGKRYCTRENPEAQGGYYTQQQMRELVSYAAERHITVIPEIEMPGHSEEVLAAYPEVSCDGTGQGSSDFCAGKEATFKMLEAVLSEVIDVFPSPYIHIGGDEAAKNTWRTCPHCKKRMEQEKLESVEELQSYFICRMERFVNSKGRRIIGWDEILEGGLAPDATVMSWRGTAGGLKAIKAGHDVVMTPGEYYYLDYTQDAPFKEPISIGGYTPLRTAYDYDPADPSLTADELKHLLGVQGNLWSEYIPTDAHAEYMYYPRAFAVAETGWSRAADKDYERFHANAIALCKMLKEKGFSTFDIANEYGERKESFVEAKHLARGCKVTYNLPYSRQWPGAGDTALTDGVQGGWTYLDHKWQGTMRDMDVTIDLGAVKPVHCVKATFMHSEGAWVHVPKLMEVMTSVDGVNYEKVGTAWGYVPDGQPKMLFQPYMVVCNVEARYVRVHAAKHDREGAWLFTDEIVVN
ncbi:MAG: family 20 glycosylhydrolase [Muribaculaceae bacterium]